MLREVGRLMNALRKSKIDRREASVMTACSR